MIILKAFSDRQKYFSSLSNISTIAHGPKNHTNTSADYVVLAKYVDFKKRKHNSTYLHIRPPNANATSETISLFPQEFFFFLEMA